MNFLNLEYFLAVARVKNITQAAAELNVSQQALSKHILNLEKELGLELFERGKKLELTDAGSCFAAHAAQILTMKDQMLRQVADATERRGGDIRIGITEARSPTYLPYLLSKFCKAFPQAQVHLTEDTSDVLFTELENDKLDLVIGIEPHDKLNFVSVPLCMEDYVLMAAPEVLRSAMTPEEFAQLSEQPESASIETFKNCPFVCFDRTKRIGRIFQDTCREIGFSPKVVIESKNLTTLLYLCALGLGVTFCPRVILEMCRRQSDIFEKVLVFPVTTMPVRTQIMISVHRDRYIPSIVREFIALSKGEFGSPQAELSTDIEFLAHLSR
ncbi:MAG: LysR family transcriptional regulator [Pyramidobacter sp.]|nr:LysR family transcriptional regulator [Pyramidobacter sp.]